VTVFEVTFIFDRLKSTYLHCVTSLAQVHYRKQSEPIVGSGQRSRQASGGGGGGGGRLLPRLPISGTQLEQHISQLLKCRGGANLSIDAGPQQLNAEFVAELKELRRQFSPSRKTEAAAAATATAPAPVGHATSAAASRRSPGLDPALVSQPGQSDGRRRTFAGQKSLSCEVNQFVQYQPSAGGERLRDYLDENDTESSTLRAPRAQCLCAEARAQA